MSILTAWRGMGDKGHPRAHPRASGSHGGPSCVWRSERRQVWLALSWLVWALTRVCVARATRVRCGCPVRCGRWLDWMSAICTCVAVLACDRPAVVCGRCAVVAVCRRLRCGGLAVSGGLSCGLVLGISFLRFNELLTRARARLELRSG